MDQAASVHTRTFRASTANLTVQSRYRLLLKSSVRSKIEDPEWGLACSATRLWASQSHQPGVAQMETALGRRKTHVLFPSGAAPFGTPRANCPPGAPFSAELVRSLRLSRECETPDCRARRGGHVVKRTGNGAVVRPLSRSHHASELATDRDNSDSASKVTRPRVLQRESCRTLTQPGCNTCSSQKAAL